MTTPTKLTPNERFAISQFLSDGWEEATAGMDFGEIMEAVRGENDGGPTIEGLDIWDPFSGTPVYATECIENLLSSLNAHMAPLLQFVQEVADLPAEGELYTPLVDHPKFGTIDGPPREKEWGEDRDDEDFEKLHELFWRCYRLQQMVPATADIQKVAEVYPFWKPMADAWPELKTLFENTLQAQMDADLAYDHRLNSGVTNLERRDVKEAFDAFKARMLVVRQECTSLMPKDEDTFVVNMGG